jgi:Rps23 Pro-64 3,4-dihydroxylase Tpa1-like proline 4-hydroxylase
MTELVTNINSKVYIYDDVISDDMFNSLYDNIEHCIDLGNQVVRFSIRDKNTHEIISINQKLYKELTKKEKTQFNTDYSNDSTYELLRRDCDLQFSYLDSININSMITNVVSELYNIKSPKIQYSSGIQYGPGYLMEIHSDEGPANQRLCTAVLYCNDKKDGDIGGDVLFYDNEIDANVIYTYTPKKNQLIIFDSYHNEIGIQHSVTQIENWNRYVYRIYYKHPNPKIP